MNSRALMEGLFGVRPDALAGELVLSPSFPRSWNHARLRHQNVRFSFRRSGPSDTYQIEPHFPRPMAVKLRVPAQRDRVKSVIINGVSGAWQLVPDSVGRPTIEIFVPAFAGAARVAIIWEGQILAAPPQDNKESAIAAAGRELNFNSGMARIESISDPQKALEGLQISDYSFRAKAVGAHGHRTVFARVRQGEMAWCLPIHFEIRPAFEIVAEADGSNGFRLRNNNSFRFDSSVVVRVGNQSRRMQLSASRYGLSNVCGLSAEGMLPGSQPVAVEVKGITIAVGTVTDWTRKAAGDTDWESVQLGAVFNDRITKLFQNEYLSPRSPYCSLAIPKQGIGSWCHPDATFEIDDSGVRGLSDRADGRIVLPQGIPFATPGAGDTANIAFVSQWDNYPDALVVPLNGLAAHLYLLLAGTTNSMQSRFDNGEILVTYSDGIEARLALHNPTTWWPIDQDYFIDSFAFRRPEPIPPRIDLKTGAVRVAAAGQTAWPGGRVPGGTATVLDVPLDPGRELRSLTIRALANEVVVGLMAATLVRPRKQ